MGVVKKIELGVDALSDQDVYSNTIMIDLSGHQAGQVKISSMQEEIVKAAEGKLKIQDVEQHWRTETPFQFFFFVNSPNFNASLLHGKKITFGPQAFGLLQLPNKRIRKFFLN